MAIVRYVPMAGVPINHWRRRSTRRLLPAVVFVANQGHRFDLLATEASDQNILTIEWIGCAQ
jgi:hypothetical protein